MSVADCLGAAKAHAKAPVSSLGAILLLSLGGCARSSVTPEDVRLSSNLIAKCQTTPIAESHESVVASYWPEGTWPEAGDQLVRTWYSTQLCAMGEEPLRLPNDGVRIRFLWLRTFHHGIAVRVEFDGQEATLHAVELDGAGGYTPGAVHERLRRDMDRRQWAELEALLRRARFWSRATSGDPQSCDGAQWVVEVATPKRYHLVDRQSGKELAPIGHYLLELSGLDLGEIY